MNINVTNTFVKKKYVKSSFVSLPMSLILHLFIYTNNIYDTGNINY